MVGKKKQACFFFTTTIFAPSPGVKITRGPRPLPRSTGPGAQQAPRNFRGLNIENGKYIDISTAGPADSDEGP